MSAGKAIGNVYLLAEVFACIWHLATGDLTWLPGALVWLTMVMALLNLGFELEKAGKR